MTTIVALESKNVKRLKAVQIKPDGSLVIIGGRNAQGKTSVLDSIMYALAGKRALPKKPLRDGEEYGKVVLELDDGLIVTRSFTEDGGGTLRVENKDGAIFRGPQKILDDLVGRMTFDPLAFDEQKPVERLATLARMIGLDLGKLDGERTRHYEDRTTAGRLVKQLEGALAQMAEHDAEVPADELSISDMALELEAADKEVNAAARAKGEKVAIEETIAAKLERVDEVRSRCQSTVDGLTRQIAEARKNAEDAVSALVAEKKDLTGKLPDLEKRAETLADARQAQEEVRTRLREAEGINHRVRQNAVRAHREEELAEKKKEYSELTEKIRAVDTAKGKALAEADLPIEGLAFGDDDVSYGGVPWDQASLAERISVSVAMGFALNPKLRVLLVRDASALDEDHLALVARLAEENEGQLWLERVGDRDEAAVVIEDGMVRGAQPPAEEGPADEPEQPSLGDA